MLLLPMGYSALSNIVSPDRLTGTAEVSIRLAFHYDPTTWGTVGQWASAVGTTLAFIAAVYVIRRDAKVRRRSQSRKVVYYEAVSDRETDDIEGKYRRWYDATIKNLSDEPIYDVWLFMVSERGRRLIDNLNGVEVLLPGESFHRRSGYSFSFRYVDVIFRDNSGFWWRRSLDGKLEEHTLLRRWAFKYPHLSSPRRFFIWLRKRRRSRRIKKERRQRLRARNGS